jgi:hypothetical protein
MRAGSSEVLPGIFVSHSVAIKNGKEIGALKVHVDSRAPRQLGSCSQISFHDRGHQTFGSVDLGQFAIQFRMMRDPAMEEWFHSISVSESIFIVQERCKLSN